MSAPAPAVFLSYASQDAEAARHLRDALCAAGIEVWFDQSELRGGDAWDAMIRRQVKECALFVPVISAASNARSEGYFRLEWRLAVERSQLMADDQPFLLPVLIDDTVEPAARVPDRFRERQWTRVDTRDALAAFAQRVARLLAGDAARAPAVAAAPAAAPAATRGSDRTEPSIAVLPFANMSADPENEYFSDGLSEELLNVLAKNAALKVTGRTSSFAFKGRHEDLRVIGQKLGVATLLEGSVRKAGNRVRITAQLLKASDGFHLWSETYDRVLDDIFAVQDEIAQAVSKALDVALLGRAPAAPPATPTKGDGAVYDLLLQAKHFANLWSGPALTRAVELYRQVLARSPDDARAWAGLANALFGQAAQGFIDSADGYRQAREAAERALALDDSLAEAHLHLATIIMTYEYRAEDAAAEIARARALAPGDGSVLATAAMVAGFRHQFDEALQLSREAIERDPLSAKTYMFRARVLNWCGRLDESVQAYRRALELAPDITTAHAGLGNVLVALGRPGEALAEASQERVVGYRSWALAMAYHALGDVPASDRELETLIAEGPGWSFQVACVYGFRGEIDPAFEWLERALALRDSGIALTSLTRHLDSLHGDPRWPLFLARIGAGGGQTTAGPETGQGSAGSR